MGQGAEGRGAEGRGADGDGGNAPVLVLVRPQMGENVGAAARAMLNFGLDRLRLVAPRDGWPNPRATALASGAGRVLDCAGVFATTAEAVADCTHVFATTARTRELTKRVLSPEQAMAEARTLGAQGNRVAVLFGPERAGLGNDDIATASAIVTVPVNPAFFSLNLAQCVLLLAYEYGKQTTPRASGWGGATGDDWANRAEIAALAEQYEASLDEAGFFFPPQKAPSMRLVLRNLWNRLPLTHADVRIFHGIRRQLMRRRD